MYNGICCKGGIKKHMRANISEDDHYKDKGALSVQTRYLVLNLIAPATLFILTLCTTIMTGVLVSGSEYLILTSVASVWKGIPYAIGALIILGSHALGHYIQARLHGVKAYTPYFIPALGFIGTVGAYMKIQWPISDRKALVKIFAAGPICGFLAAWIVLIVGLFFSEVIDIALTGSPVKIGDSIIMHVTSLVFFGNLPSTKDVMLHPVAYAGWLGLFYNFCHLLPIGRFDGGRLIYALWGYRVTQWVSFITIGILLLIGFILPDSTTWIGIAILGLISTIRFRQQYPSERYEQPLEKPMLIVLGIIAAIFIVSFTPTPLPILNK